MARRKSYQRGSVQEHNGQWTVVYREFDHAKRKWVQKREGPGKLKNKKTALKAAEPILAMVNERNNDTGWHCINAPLTFKEFITDEQIVTEGSAVLTETISGDFLLNCDPVVTGESEMIS